jgi:hypothetical protein
MHAIAAAMATTAIIRSGITTDNDGSPPAAAARENSTLSAMPHTITMPISEARTTSHVRVLGIGSGDAGRRVRRDAANVRREDSAVQSPLDVARDGRFLFIRQPPDPGAQIVLNWSTEVAMFRNR